MSDTSPTQPAADPVAAEEKTLDQLLAEALARIEEQKDARMRAMAEADNARKRAQADVQAAHKFAVERMAESLLPVMDSLKAAPAAGERFDPHLHQAIAAVDAAGAEVNSIVAVMQKGYRLHDRVLRPALV